MKALSLWQPWATLLVRGAKTVETRSWATEFRGRLAIHAALRWVGSDVEQWRDDPAFVAAFEALAKDEPEEKPGCTFVDVGGCRLPLGRVVGSVEIVDCVRTEEVAFGGPGDDLCRVGMRGGWQLPQEDRPFGNYAKGRYAWITAKTIWYRFPVAFKGHQGFFDVPDDLLTEETR